MLTMQPIEHKKAIVREAARILKPGGYYGIHELGLQPDQVPEDIKQSVYKDLSANIRVHARPLTVAEWSALLKNYRAVHPPSAVMTSPFMKLDSSEAKNSAT